MLRGKTKGKLSLAQPSRVSQVAWKNLACSLLHTPRAPFSPILLLISFRPSPSNALSLASLQLTRAPLHQPPVVRTVATRRRQTSTTRFRLFSCQGPWCAGVSPPRAQPCCVANLCALTLPRKPDLACPLHPPRGPTYPRYSRISQSALALLEPGASHTRTRSITAGLVCRAVRRQNQARATNTLPGTQIAPSPRLLLYYTGYSTLPVRKTVILRSKRLLV